MYRKSEILLLLLFHNVVGYKYSFGDCPNIKSVEKFNMTKFLGNWYGVEANDNSFSCTKFTLAVTENNLKFAIDESTNLRYLTFIQYFFSRSGIIKMTHSEGVSSMKIKWHWTFPSEEMIVFETNYNDYAGVFFCSKALLASETRIFILSRQQNLTMEYTDKVKESLRLNGYSSKGMSRIEHKNCPTKNSENTVKIIIKQDTFSPKTLGKKMEKALKENFEKTDCSEEQSTETKPTNKKLEASPRQHT